MAAPADDALAPQLGQTRAPLCPLAAQCVADVEAARTPASDAPAADGSFDGADDDGIGRRTPSCASGSARDGEGRDVFARWEALVRGARLDAKINRAYAHVHGEYRIHEAKKLMLIYMVMILLALASSWFGRLAFVESTMRGAMSSVNAFSYMCITLAANEKFLAKADNIFAAFIGFNVAFLSYLTYGTAWGTIPFVIVSMFIAELPAQHNTFIIVTHALSTPAVKLFLSGANRFAIGDLFEAALLLVIIMTTDVTVARCVFDRNASHKAIFKLMYIRLSERTTAFSEANRFVHAAACSGLYETYRHRATGFKMRLTSGTQLSLDIRSVIEHVHAVHVVPTLPDSHAEALGRTVEVWRGQSGVLVTPPKSARRLAPRLSSCFSSGSSPLSAAQVAPHRTSITSPRALVGSVHFDWIMAQSPSTPGLIDHVFRTRTSRTASHMPKHAGTGEPGRRTLRLTDAADLKWMPREDYILTRYRENYTTSMNVASLFVLHNQTFSIWTHLLPAILLPCAYGVLHVEHLGEMPVEFRAVSVVATALTTMQLAVSAAAHTFYNNSIQSYRFWWKLDFVFICVGMYSYCFRFGYAALLCESPSRRAEFYVLCLAVCVTSLMVTLFHAKEGYRVLGMVFVFVVCNVVPQITMVFSGEHTGPRAPIFRSAIGSYASFGVALVFYLAKFPERVGNGGFDVLMSSHQIWHVGIAGAHVIDAIYMPLIVARLPLDEICAAAAS